MHKTVRDITEAKRKGRKISVITAYDYSMAVLCDRAGVDIMLVGDSAGMVMLGYQSTIPVTMEQMCLFTQAVSNARKSAMLVSDLAVHVVPGKHAGGHCKLGKACQGRMRRRKARRRGRDGRYHKEHSKRGDTRNGPHRAAAPDYRTCRRIQGTGKGPQRPDAGLYRMQRGLRRPVRFA